MKAKDNTTEEKIVEAAQDVFHEKGFDGARMQEIADRANINKGLLHYYFRTKNRLFEAIFVKAFDILMSRVNVILASDMSLIVKIDAFVDRYIELLLKHPSIPRFVINELSRNPDQFVHKIMSRDKGPNIDSFFNAVEAEIKAGNIRQVNPEHLLLNIVSLSVFPFVGRPMLQAIFKIDNQSFIAMMKERKYVIVDFIKHAILIEP